MSGPISLEPGDAGQDTLALRLAEPRPPRRRPRWALDDATLAIRLPGHGPDEEAVSTLAAELADAIGPAVHPYEVAALPEAEGLSASLIKERYGHPNLFSLATALYERVPRTFPEPPPATDPWRPDTLRCLLRGVLFALPALAYLLIAPLWPIDRHAPVLIVAGIASWAWGQALGHRAHLRLVTGRREASGTLLAGSALGAAVATALAALPADGPLAIGVAAAQSLYLAGASVLLVLGHERLLGRTQPRSSRAPRCSRGGSPGRNCGSGCLSSPCWPRRWPPDESCGRGAQARPRPTPGGRDFAHPCRTACSDSPRRCSSCWKAGGSRTR